MSDPTTAVIMPLYQAKGWLKLIGVMSIITGIMYCLTIFGAVIGWLPIWMGVLACQAADRYRIGVEAGDIDSSVDGSRKLGTLITIMGILMLLSLIGSLVGIIMMLMMVFAGVAAAATNASLFF